jgi:hypothetical protein
MMKKILMLIVSMLLWQGTIYADNLIGLSFSPVTFIEVILTSMEADRNHEIGPEEYIWLGIDFNFDSDGKENSIGLYIHPNYFGLRAQRRTFSGDHRGFFYGLYGILEYRKMYWGYNDKNDIEIQTFWGNERGDNPYHSIGATIGGDIGVRFGGKNMRCTIYTGLGLPLFYCFGDTPVSGGEMLSFYGLNTVSRIIDIGVKIDLFY